MLFPQPANNVEAKTIATSCTKRRLAIQFIQSSPKFMSIREMLRRPLKTAVNDLRFTKHRQFNVLYRLKRVRRYFAAIARSESPPNALVDAIANKVNGPVAEYDIYTAAVLAARSVGNVARIKRAINPFIPSTTSTVWRHEVLVNNSISIPARTPRRPGVWGVRGNER